MVNEKKTNEGRFPTELILRRLGKGQESLDFFFEVMAVAEQGTDGNT
jgi:hypothetical protein